MLEKNLAHYRTLLSIEHTLGAHRKGAALYLDACRAKLGAASRTEAAAIAQRKNLLMKT